MTTAVATTVKVTDRDGVETELLWEPTQSLMEALRDNGYPILASCGGNAACATCHVFVGEQAFDYFGERSEDELDLLEDAEAYDPGCSRLSCQLEQGESPNVLAITIAPEDD